MKKVEDRFCLYCPNVEQTVTHLFVSCPIAVSSYAVQVLGEMNCYESRLNLVRDNCFFFSSVILHKHYTMVINRCFAEAHTDRGMNSLMVESKTHV